MKRFRILIIGVSMLFFYLLSNEYLYQVSSYKVENLLDADVSNYYTPELEEYYKLTQQDKLSLKSQKKAFNNDMKNALKGETYFKRLSLWYKLNNSTEISKATKQGKTQAELTKINKQIKNLSPDDKKLYLEVVSSYQGGSDEE